MHMARWTVVDVLLGSGVDVVEACFAVSVFDSEDVASEGAGLVGRDDLERRELSADLSLVDQVDGHERG